MNEFAQTTGIVLLVPGLPMPSRAGLEIMRDVEDLVGLLMRALGGEEITGAEVADLQFEAEGELLDALHAAALRDAAAAGLVRAPSTLNAQNVTAITASLCELLHIAAIDGDVDAGGNDGE